MKYYPMILLIAFSLSVNLASCSTNNPIEEMEQPLPPNKPGDNQPENPDIPMSNTLKITVGHTTFDVALADNAATTAFKALLPITVDMSDMNSNEKYCYLSGNLPTAPSNPGTIRTGDLMLYGSNCVVLFYETFSTSYRYTRLGSVVNSSGLAATLGSGNVRITFEMK